MAIFERVSPHRAVHMPNEERVLTSNDAIELLLVGCGCSIHPVTVGQKRIGVTSAHNHGGVCIFNRMLATVAECVHG